MECIHCNKTYSTISSLNNHQRTSKSCIMIQEQKGILCETKFQCKSCKKQVTTKFNLDKHVTICKFKFKEETIKHTEKKTLLIIEDIKVQYQDEKEEIEFLFRTKQEELEYELTCKDNQIKLLKELLEKKSSKTVNHVKIQNYITIDQSMKKELVTECFRSKYNFDVFKRGVPGFADFIIEEFIIDNKAFQNCFIGPSILCFI